MSRGAGLTTLFSFVLALASARGSDRNALDSSSDFPGRDGGGAGSSSGAFAPDGGGTNGPCRTCSADLHDVITCGDNPTVVQTCPADQACSPSWCVPACEGAAANRSSIGCDYYAVAPDANTPTYSTAGAAGSCFAAFVTNNWTTDMKVSLVWKGQTIDATPFAYVPQGSGGSLTYQAVPATGIPPGGMAIVFLNQWAPGAGQFEVPCPAGVHAAIENEDVVTHGTSIGPALELQTSVPAVVYDIYPFGGATSYVASASLLLPVSAWDTNYVATTMAVTSSGTYQFPGGVDVVAREDGTQVTLLPTTNVSAGAGVGAATKNAPTVYTLNRGQILHVLEMPDATGRDLTGSVIQSNKPVGVWGEHLCEVETSPPPWRVVGAVDGTTLSYDPPVPGAPPTLSKGQLVEFAGPEAFRVKSQDGQHPFYLAGHRPSRPAPNTDCDAAHQQIPPVMALGHDYVAVANEAVAYDLGGPETVNVVPAEQFLPSYVFFTDPTYGYTDLALTRKKAPDGSFKDVTLDCLGTVSGWAPVGASGDYEYVHVRLRHAGAAQGGCDNGRHTITSTVPFGVTVWGYDFASSYAYPAGASVKPINTVVVPPTPVN